MVALALPMMRVVAFGGAAKAGPALLAAALASLAIGLLPYAALLLFARAFYALGDSRTPAIVAIASALLGVATMAALAPVTHGSARVAALGVGHTAAYAVGAVVLGTMLLPPARPAVRAADARGRALLRGRRSRSGAWGAMTRAATPKAASSTIGVLAALGAVGAAGYAWPVRRWWPVARRWRSR